MTAVPVMATVDEADFFGEVPVALTVSRLAQPLADTPAAVTILDRETIARLGLRDLTDALRLVPGYMVSGYNGANPVGAYHAPLDEFGTRNLVLVDGRSLYTSTYLGGTVRGMSTVRLEDVERIEILRGSNSAAFGANALFGVINIVTRHAADTQGGEIKLDVGSANIRDAYARIGWQTEAGHQRLSVNRRSDSGYRFVDDDRSIVGLNWRGDWSDGGRNEWTTSLGITQSDTHHGRLGNVSNPLRNTYYENIYGNLIWRRQMTDSNDIQLNISFDQDTIEDNFIFQGSPPEFVGSLVDQGALERRLNVEVQTQSIVNASFRWVAGAGFKQESAKSLGLFNRRDWITITDYRVFGAAEWMLSPSITLHGALFAGDNSAAGRYADPRVFLNYRLDESQSFRLGYTQARRLPTLFEQRGERVVTAPAGAPSVTLFRANGDLVPEQLKTWEIGYFLSRRDWGLMADVRIYRESLTDYIADLGGALRNFNEGFLIQGLEYQIQWDPDPHSKLIFNQSFIDFETRIPRSFYTASTSLLDRTPAKWMSSFVYMRRLNGGWDASVQWHHRSSMSWRRTVDNLMPATSRVDVRVAKVWSTTYGRAEAALTLQNITGDQPEFLISRPSVFPRRAFATFHVEF